jgi:hypothetical protein
MERDLGTSGHSLIEILSRHFLQDTEESHEERKSRSLFSLPGFEQHPNTSVQRYHDVNTLGDINVGEWLLFSNKHTLDSLRPKLAQV